MRDLQADPKGILFLDKIWVLLSLCLYVFVSVSGSAIKAKFACTIAVSCDAPADASIVS